VKGQGGKSSAQSSRHVNAMRHPSGSVNSRIESNGVLVSGHEDLSLLISKILIQMALATAMT
jgi:hypothetical protein